jgi:hypothetical protein
MSAAETETSETAPETNGGPVLLWEGTAAFFAAPDGGRVIRYDQDGEEKFIAIPAELVPALQMLAANPGALVAISQSPMGGIARRMVGRLTERAVADGHVGG